MDASPVLLEPIVTMTVTVPDKYTGDVMGDLNKRRGRVLGMNPVAGGKQEVVADVPTTEIYGLLHRPSLHDGRKRRVLLCVRALRAGSLRRTGERGGCEGCRERVSSNSKSRGIKLEL